MDPNKNAAKLKDYGVKIKDGDIIEMILNLIDLTLSYKINNTDYGKAYDVDKTSYKVAATLCAKNTKWTLLSYQFKN